MDAQSTSFSRNNRCTALDLQAFSIKLAENLKRHSGRYCDHRVPAINVQVFRYNQLMAFCYRDNKTFLIRKTIIIIVILIGVCTGVQKFLCQSAGVYIQRSPIVFILYKSGKVHTQVTVRIRFRPDPDSAETTIIAIVFHNNPANILITIRVFILFCTQLYPSVVLERSLNSQAAASNVEIAVNCKCLPCRNDNTALIPGTVNIQSNSPVKADILCQGPWNQKLKIAVKRF